VPALSSIPLEILGMAGLTVLFAVMAMRLARWREP
jgi:hypothetical protein